MAWRTKSGNTPALRLSKAGRVSRCSKEREGTGNSEEEEAERQVWRAIRRVYRSPSPRFRLPLLSRVRNLPSY